MTTLRASDEDSARPTLEQEELRGIARTVAEIHWLLAVLVLLYEVFGDLGRDSQLAISAALFFYVAFVMSFRYANFYRRETRWKIAIESWVMIAFITWVLSQTGGLASPLLNLFLLPVITSALTLGKVTTLIQVGLIAACELWLSGAPGGGDILSLSFLGGFGAQIAPVVLVAYVVTMFSADIRYGMTKARLLSETDELTQLLNTRGFAIASSRLFGQAVRYGRPASVLMMDADGFKTVNDSHGHEAGNQLLRRISRIIETELRATDVLARYGGDEFIALLPETPLGDALEVAERIRVSVSGSPLVIDGRRVACSLSIGIAAYPDDGATLDAVTSRADRAMYDAKQAGRDRVARWAA